MKRPANRTTAAPAAPTVRDALTELRREMRMREHLYPGWVASKKITLDESHKRLTRLQRAIGVLEKVADAEDAEGLLL